MSPHLDTTVLKPNSRAFFARARLTVGMRVVQTCTCCWRRRCESIRQRHPTAAASAAGASWKPSRRPWAFFYHGSVTSARSPKVKSGHARQASNSIIRRSSPVAFGCRSNHRLSYRSWDKQWESNWPRSSAYRGSSEGLSTLYSRARLSDSSLAQQPGTPAPLPFYLSQGYHKMGLSIAIQPLRHPTFM